MEENDFEQRLSKLEREVAALRKQLESLSDPRPWWERIAGTFANDPIYEEAMRLGREYRKEQNPNRSTDDSV